MKPFDGNEYRKRVMTRLLDDFGLADPVTGDPFLVCDVDPDADTAAVTARLDAVVAFWQKDRNHPKYKGIAAQLVGRREAYAAILGDPTARAAAARRVNGARAETDAAVFEQLDKLAATLLKRHRGIPRSRVPALAAIAAADGMSEQAFSQWLGQHQVVEDADTDGAVPWEPAVRRQVRSALDELARISAGAGTGTDGARYRTLLTFLGVGPNATSSDLTTAHARLAEANRSRARDRVMTLTEDLLAQVSTRLLPEGGMAAYRATLRADARDTIKGDLRRLAVLTGALPAAELEAFSARLVGLGWGLGTAEARDLVRAAAHEVHLAVEVGGDFDLIVCPSCARPQPVKNRKTCTYCRAHLYLDCPACSTKIPAASDVCPGCSAPLAAWRAASTIAESAQVALDAGRLTEAGRLCAQVPPGLDPEHAPAQFRAVTAAVAEQTQRARQAWADLHRDLNRGALWAAASSAAWLARNAVDLPDSTPGRPADRPTSPEQMVALLDKQQATVTADAGEASDLPDEQAEPALGALLRRYPDCPTALEALARLPLPEPRTVTLHMDGTTAQVSWEAPAAAPRTVRYLVSRQVTWPESRADHTTVGTTSMTHLEDAAVPAGCLVRYGVIAVDGNRTSKEVVTGEPVFVHRDIEVLHVEVTDAGVELSWPTQGLGAAEVTLERSVDPASGMSAPMRRIRPGGTGRHLDDDVPFDVPFQYRVFLTYHGPDGELVRTDGQMVAVRRDHPPVPVTDIWAVCDEGGRTTISFASPPAGMVRVYATGEGMVPLGTLPQGAPVDLSVVDGAAVGARLVGEGRRRVVDAAGRGALAYQAVTVVGDRAAVGAVLRHVAVAMPSDLRILADDGDRVRVGFDLPAGVTEAFVCWRRDRFPTSADERWEASSGAGAAKVTNTKLALAGGFVIPAPSDGRPVFVAVYSAFRAPDPAGGTVAVAAETPATLLARQAVPVEVSYQVRVSGLLRKRLEVEARVEGPGLLPKLVVQAADREPGHVQQGTRMATHDGGDRSAVLRVEESSWPQGPSTVRLFALPVPGAEVRVVDPPEEQRRLNR